MNFHSKNTPVANNPPSFALSTANSNVNYKKNDNHVLNKNDNPTINYESTNITLLKPSGKLLDAVSAAALNSVEDGLGPVIVPITNKGILNSQNKNIPDKISVKANNKLNKLLSSYGFGDNSDTVEPIIKNSKHFRGSSPENRRSLHLDSKKNDEYNVNNSFNSSSLSSFTALKKKTNIVNTDIFKTNENRPIDFNIFKEKLGKSSNGVNDPRSAAKSALGSVDSNIVNTKNQAPTVVNKKINQNSNDKNNVNTNLNTNNNNNNNNNNNINQNLNIANSNEGNLDRPPGRLNNYDSDTNTFSGDTNHFGIGTSNFRKPNNEMLNKKLNKGKLLLLIRNLYLKKCFNPICTKNITLTFNTILK